MEVYVAIDLCQGVVDELNVFLTEESARNAEEQWLCSNSIENAETRDCKAGAGTARKRGGAGRGRCGKVIGYERSQSGVAITITITMTMTNTETSTSTIWRFRSSHNSNMPRTTEWLPPREGSSLTLCVAVNYNRLSGHCG